MNPNNQQPIQNTPDPNLNGAQTPPPDSDKITINNPNLEEYPVDYLNKIATSQKPAGLDTKSKIILGVVAGIVAFAGGLLLFMSPSAPVVNLSALQLMNDNFIKITKDEQKNIKNADLSTLNTETNLILTNFSSDIKSDISENSSKNKPKLDKTIKTKETKNLDDNKAKLNEARLSGRYDPAYQKVVLFSIENLINTSSELSIKGKKATKEMLAKNIAKLQEIYKKIDALDLSRN